MLFRVDKFYSALPFQRMRSALRAVEKPGSTHAGQRQGTNSIICFVRGLKEDREAGREEPPSKNDGHVASLCLLLLHRYAVTYADYYAACWYQALCQDRCEDCCSRAPCGTTCRSKREDRGEGGTIHPHPPTSTHSSCNAQPNVVHSIMLNHGIIWYSTVFFPHRPPTSNLLHSLIQHCCSVTNLE